MFKNCIYPCVGFFSIIGRIFIFFCFWWAYDDVDEAFSDRRLAYQNEFYAWQSPPIFKIQQLFSNSDCPKGTKLLYNYVWSGRKQFTEDGVEYESIPPTQFKYWLYESFPTKKFILCATLGRNNESYAQFGRIQQTCEERKMRSCSNGRFCVPSSYQYCPITNVQFDENGLLKTEVNQNEMPIAYFKVDTYFVSGYNNRELNLYPEQPQDDKLKEKLSSVDIKYMDKTFVSLNSVNDKLFYSINSASDFDRTISENYNKTLFYRRYTEWKYDALGVLFDYAFNIFDSLDEIIVLSNSGTITSLIYLLLICYIFPAIPVFFRFVSALKIEILFIWDISIRMILLFSLLAQSLYIIKQCQDVRKYSDLLLINDKIVGFQDQYDGVLELIESQEPYHIISIAISVGFLVIEVFLLIIICSNACLLRIRKIFKQTQIMKQIQEEFQKEEDFENLNQLNTNQVNIELQQLN